VRATYQVEALCAGPLGLSIAAPCARAAIPGRMATPQASSLAEGDTRHGRFTGPLEGTVKAQSPTVLMSTSGPQRPSSMLREEAGSDPKRTNVEVEPIFGF
jgi:hypothetical protein